MVTIEKDGVKFTVRGDILIKMESDMELPVDVYIPSRFADGTEIKALNPGFCEGLYKKIVIDDNIKRIERRAFESVIAETIVWPIGCDVIDEKVFEGSSVEVLLNIDHVKTIRRYAFSKSSIKNFHWPSACTEIPEYCFSISKLEHISGIENVEIIGVNAFEYCDIKELVWPSKCHTIPYSCFYSSQLERISNIQDVTSIEKFAFAGTMLKSIVIPAGVERIVDATFAWTGPISIVCHDGITSIGDNAFMGSKIEKFDWPVNCPVIPSSCFHNCMQLSSFSICGNVTTIGRSAFSNAGLNGFNWPTTCDEIPAGCFAGSSLKDISIPSNVTKISDRAFADCCSLKCVDLSSLLCCACGEDVFTHSYNAKILMPYYVEIENFEEV